MQRISTNISSVIFVYSSCVRSVWRNNDGDFVPLKFLYKAGKWFDSHCPAERKGYGMRTEGMNERKIIIGKDIAALCPEFCFAAIDCQVENTPYNAELRQEIEEFSIAFRETYRMEDIKKHKAIAATREAYKRCGKDPNRYRPSAEALLRRMVKGLSLYQIDTLVDLINLVSMKTGYSIGGFDADRIQGDLTLGLGKADETFEAIGRGLLNIEGLPVYRDEAGPIGTPTSDEERTKITAHTTHLLMIINGYSGPEGLERAAGYASELLRNYARAENIHVKSMKYEV